MRNEARGDLYKVWFYAMATLVLGAVLVPWLYNLGKALAEVTEGKTTTYVVHWLAGCCRSGEFTAYFKWSWALAALLLAVPWVTWLKVGGGAREPGMPWGLRLPETMRPAAPGQRLIREPHGWRMAGRGFVLSAGLWILLGWALAGAGSFSERLEPEGWLGAVLRLLPWAVGSALVQELVFRGMVLGIFLRAARPPMAILVAALLFAAVRFCVPGPGTGVVDAEASGAGFELLGQVLWRLGDPWVLVGGWFPLLAMGCVLGFARWRTASLWLPAGLHVGWLFVNAVFLARMRPMNGGDPFGRFLVGDSLLYGLIPLVCVVLTGILLHFILPPDESERDD